ncbi:MAG: hypothetical protein K2J14_07050, partial [Treponemataceae bacterium]|nr:hypothetical protein [Treponemataceae bacterium]
DITLEDEKTVGDVLRGLETAFAQNNATTIGITLNGTNIGADAFDAAAQTPLADDTAIDVTVVSEDDVKAAFAAEAETSRTIAAKLEQIPVQLQSGKDKEANAIISQLADLVDGVCHTASLAALFPPLFEKLTIAGKSVSEFFAEFSDILNDFRQALEDKDNVLIGDLAEYEISPRLTDLADAIASQG